jgi:hypothetical protein
MTIFDLSKVLPGGRDYPLMRYSAPDGTMYEWRTNGWAAIIRRALTSSAETTRDGMAKFIGEKVALVTPADAWVADVGSLIGSLGEPNRDFLSPCPGCPCGGCEESGGGDVLERAEARTGVLCGVECNFNLIACAMQDAGFSGSVRVWKLAEEHGLVIDSEDGFVRVVAMGMKQGSALDSDPRVGP